jgi:Integrase core domain
MGGFNVAGMLTLVRSIVAILACRFRSRAVLELENLALRNQLHLLRRQRPGRPRLFAIDRLLWVWLYRLWPCCLDAMVLVKPATVVQWHRQGFRLFWRWRSRSGRPSVDREVRKLIREMSSANPLWGAPRIHGELLKLGIEISQATVAKYMVRRRGTPSPTWRSFLLNQVQGIAAIGMFVVASASFRLLYVMIILAHDRRKIIRTAVTEHPTAGWLSRQVTEAFPWDTAPRYLLRDRDASYGSDFRSRVEAMVITAPRSPWQNAYVERVIGSIRRECLDHLMIFNERHLRRVLSSYVYYYQRTRTHLSLDKDCPTHDRLCHAGSDESSPSRRSAVCITATNVSPPDLSRITAHQWCVGTGTLSAEDLCIGGSSISIRGRPFVVQSAPRFTFSLQFDSNSHGAFNLRFRSDF